MTILDEAIHRFAEAWALGDEALAKEYAGLAFRAHAELVLRRIEFELWGWTGHPTLRELESR